MPRILAAIVIGAGLAISGAALQGMFRNPLLDPGIIGVTAGAGFGGTLAILLVGGGYVVLGAAFVVGMGSMIIVRFLASVKGRTSTLTLVLAGVVVTAFFESAISIVKLLADPHQKLPAITYWLMGSIAGTNYESLALMTLAILPASIVIYLLRYQINILSLGEDKARALGAPIELVHAFAERFGIPVVTTLMGIGAVDTTSDLSLHMLGMHGTAYANYAVEDCDFLFAIGSRFDDRVAGKVKEFAPGATIAHLDIDASEIGKVKHVDWAHVADAKRGLPQLHEGRRAASRRTSAAGASTCSELKTRHAARLRPRVAGDPGRVRARSS